MKKELHEDNRHWDFCKFQLHWNKLDWVNPRIKDKRKQPYLVSSNKLFIDKDLRTAH